jgi:hypothetical protein
VTLAVTPDEVNILVAARSKGDQLSLSLRGVNDHKSVAKRKAKPAPPPTEVVLAQPTPPPVPPDRSRYVTIYRGNGRADRVRLGMPRSDEDAAESETTASPAFLPLEK